MALDFGELERALGDTASIIESFREIAQRRVIGEEEEVDLGIETSCQEQGAGFKGCPAPFSMEVDQ